MKGIYKIAEKIIEINSIYDKVHDYCKEYRFDGTPDFTVTATENDIEFERIKSSDGEKYSDSYLEELAVYRKIAEKMPEYDTFLFHGSAIAVDGQCYLFTAKSGTGKSTHARLWRELLGNRAVMVNDDKPLIRVNNNSVTVFGTPYNGKHRLGNNISVPLKAVCILTRSQNNYITRLTKSQAYNTILQQTYRPIDKNSLSKTLLLIDMMTQQTDLWKLGCNMDISAAVTSYNAMA